MQNYYPFGEDMGDATMNYAALPINLHLYNGKEWQPELNLNTYDFGARHYDPLLGRWTSADPLAEESEDMSPYNYVNDNPMNMVDPDGMQANGGNIIKDTTLGEGSASGVGGSGFDVYGTPVTPAPGWSLGAGLTVVNGVVQLINADKAFDITKAKVTTQNWKKDLSGVQGNVQHANTGGNYQPSTFEQINTDLKDVAGTVSITNVLINKRFLPNLPDWFVGDFGRGFVTPGASDYTSVLSLQSRRAVSYISKKIGFEISTKGAGDVAEVIGKGAVITTIATTTVENVVYSKAVIDGKQNLKQVEDHYNDLTTSPIFWLYKHTFEPLLKMIPPPKNGVAVPEK